MWSRPALLLLLLLLRLAGVHILRLSPLLCPVMVPLRIPHDTLTAIANIVETVLLFEPTMTQGVNKRAAERNAHFVGTYTNFR